MKNLSLLFIIPCLFLTDIQLVHANNVCVGYYNTKSYLDLTVFSGKNLTEFEIDFLRAKTYDELGNIIFKYSNSPDNLYKRSNNLDFLSLVALGNKGKVRELKIKGLIKSGYLPVDVHLSEENLKNVTVNTDNALIYLIKEKEFKLVNDIILKLKKIDETDGTLPDVLKSTMEFALKESQFPAIRSLIKSFPNLTERKNNQQSILEILVLSIADKRFTDKKDQQEGLNMIDFLTESILNNPNKVYAKLPRYAPVAFVKKIIADQNELFLPYNLKVLSKLLDNFIKHDPSEINNFIADNIKYFAVNKTAINEQIKRTLHPYTNMAQSTTPETSPYNEKPYMGEMKFQETEKAKFIRDYIGIWVDSPAHGLQKYREAEAEWNRRQR